ncbi:MAG: hypothetical protein VCC99_02910 [Alphaproteobacteria bacterium]
MNNRFAVGLTLGLALAGCASLEAPTSGSEIERCRAVWAAADGIVADAGTGDAAAQPVAGHRYLRADRFLASFSDSIAGEAIISAWVDRLAALGRDAARVEVGNLPAADRARLEDIARAAVGRGALAAIDYCSPVLRNTVVGAPANVRVDDHYSDLQRLVGLYPLTAVAVAIGYDRWRAANLPAFQSTPPLVGTPIVYAPANGDGALEAAEVAGLLSTARRANPLPIPEPSPTVARRLIEAYAPVWIVDTIGVDDRIGAVTASGVDTATPAVYHRLSWARWGGDIVLQISYLAWFPARPRDGAFDLLGGRYDSVIWRVTLGIDGRPLIYDSIHGCGCYHLFFPVPPLVARPSQNPRDIRERPETPAPGPVPAAGQRIVLRLAAGSHYLLGVALSDDDDQASTQPSTAASYPLRSMHDLRALAQPDGGTRGRSMVRMGWSPAARAANAFCCGRWESPAPARCANGVPTRPRSSDAAISTIHG